mgnify:CR=1 FL=1
MARLPTWMGGKKEEPTETLEEKLDKLGVHFNTDRFFGDRLANIETELTELLSEDTVDGMQISDTRKRLLKMTMKRLRYAWGNIPFGKAREDSRYARGMTAARKLLLRAQRAIMSDAEDKQIENYCVSIFARIDMLVGFTFDSENVSINKSVIVHTIQKQDTRYGGQEEEV